MKKLLVILTLLALLSALAGCGADASEQAANAVDVDLTALSTTMLYSEVSNMNQTPENYMGKTVKIRGTYNYYHDPNSGNDYFNCLVSDATACCSAGIEFVLTDDYSFPDDYPQQDAQICVMGTFDTYMEGQNRYCTLRNATLCEVGAAETAS